MCKNTIFLLTREDAFAISQLEKQCFDEVWTEEVYHKVLPEKQVAFDLLVEAQNVILLPELCVFALRGEQGELFGYLALRIMVQAKLAEIYNVGILPALRKQGYAHYLLHHILHVLDICGIEETVLELRASNKAALALYEKNGFVACGLRKGYYLNKEDAVLMQRPLLAHI